MPDGEIGLKDVGRIFLLQWVVRDSGEDSTVDYLRVDEAGADHIKISFWSRGPGRGYVEADYLPIQPGDETISLPNYLNQAIFEGTWLGGSDHLAGKSHLLRLGSILDITDRLAEFPECKLAPATTSA